MIVVGGWPGRIVIGQNGRFGVRPDEFSLGGDFDNPLLSDVDAGDELTEFAAIVQSVPPSGVVTMDDLGGFSHVGAADGSYSTVLTLYTWPSGGPLVKGTPNETITTNIGTVSVTGSATVTLGPVVSVAAGTVSAPTGVTGTAAVALGPVTSAAAGTVLPVITGVGSVTLGPVTSVATGVVAALPAVTGSAAVTLGPVTSAAAGVVSALPAVTGVGAVTLGPVTSAAAGSVLPVITGAGAVTLGAFTSAASGTTATPVTGTAAVTLGAVTSTAAGAVTDNPTDGCTIEMVERAVGLWLLKLKGTRELVRGLVGESAAPKVPYIRWNLTDVEFPDFIPVTMPGTGRQIAYASDVPMTFVIEVCGNLLRGETAADSARRLVLSLRHTQRTADLYRVAGLRGVSGIQNLTDVEVGAMRQRMRFTLTLSATLCAQAPEETMHTVTTGIHELTIPHTVELTTTEP